jgi:hypothetical protein
MERQGQQGGRWAKVAAQGSSKVSKSRGKSKEKQESKGESKSARKAREHGGTQDVSNKCT